MVLVFAAVVGAAPAGAQTSATSSAPESSSAPGSLPVSLDKIRGALQQRQPLTLRTLDERPTFRVQILERQKIEELLATLNFKSTSPAPPNGLYGYEQQRQIWNPVDHPMMQPYAAFNQGELLTIALENLIGKYVVGQAATSIKNAVHASAAAAAREEVRHAIADYCAAQPNGGAGIQICETSSAFAR